MNRHTNAFLDARLFFSLVCFAPLFSSPAAAQTKGPIVVICQYQNGHEDWTIDLSARTASVEGVGRGSQGESRYTDSGGVTEITEKEITWQRAVRVHQIQIESLFH
jgi:hypothetical protein